MTFEWESRSRTIEVDGERIRFANWHDLLRDLTRGDVSAQRGGAYPNTLLTKS